MTQHLAQLEASGLIRLEQVEPELEYSFQHGLLQEAAYGSLLKSELAEWHRAVGMALEALYPDASLRANWHRCWPTTFWRPAIRSGPSST